MHIGVKLTATISWWSMELYTVAVISTLSAHFCITALAIWGNRQTDVNFTYSLCGVMRERGGWPSFISRVTNVSVRHNFFFAFSCFDPLLPLSWRFTTRLFLASFFSRQVVSVPMCKKHKWLISATMQILYFLLLMVHLRRSFLFFYFFDTNALPPLALTDSSTHSIPKEGVLLAVQLTFCNRLSIRNHNSLLTSFRTLIIDCIHQACAENYLRVSYIWLYFVSIFKTCICNRCIFVLFLGTNVLRRSNIYDKTQLLALL